MHDTLGQRVLLEAGGASRFLVEEITRLAAARVLVIAARSSAGVAAELTAGLPVAHRWPDVVEHVPVELADRARAAAAASDTDAIVAIGGGSTTGLAKAVALTSRLPIVAVPTTYAGSEATPVWGLTSGGQKTTGVNARVLPVSVIYDATLTLSLPVELSVASGLNALAHCVDSLWAPGSDPINTALALEGTRVLRSGLPRLVAEPQDLDAREQCLYGAYLAATAFASAGSGLHHKICHVLGGAYGLPHAQTHAIVLPHVLALNAPAVPDAERRLAAALGAERRLAAALGAAQQPTNSAVRALEQLRREVDAPRSLRDIGLKESELAEAAARVAEVAPGSNPVPTPLPVLEALLRAAWAGDEPQAVAEGGQRSCDPSTQS